MAKQYLKKQGYKIVESNFRVKAGELDLVVQKGEFLVFVEVKTRQSQSPLIQMTRAKCERIRKLGQMYLEQKLISDLQPRFDVIAITFDQGQAKLEHLENAF
ncbi:MAG: hypothetical protein A2527_08645 [Candidatus Lambdaproteobacteria bacterium RIFOXYD2_FULL_50_16]|uniref:Uncharacterized protein n=1 Tax=Candidatus Lambdaproteobacteria bacterium RIFOXYD2_FULL_50_16 TaxID=1817772 RepID=A0A1F6GAZ3_9PROT|nr:MAG: hypothetical protein A2527_08645 [Candidatus Lambdaproteobacteria bacterium RIFOXYD2_FULL_50_16]